MALLHKVFGLLCVFLGVFCDCFCRNLRELLVGHFGSAAAEDIKLFADQLTAIQIKEAGQQLSLCQIAGSPEYNQGGWACGLLGTNNIYPTNFRFYFRHQVGSIHPFTIRSLSNSFNWPWIRQILRRVYLKSDKSPYISSLSHFSSFL